MTIANTRLESKDSSSVRHGSTRPGDLTVAKVNRTKRVPSRTGFTDSDRGFNERFGSSLARGREMRRVAVFLGLLSLLFAAVVAALAVSERVVPWIVHVDRQGQATVLGPNAASALNDETLLRAYVLRFMFDMSRLQFETDTRRARAFLESAVEPNGPVAQLVANELVRIGAATDLGRHGVSFANPVFGGTGDGRWSASWDELPSLADGSVSKRRRKAILTADLTVTDGSDQLAPTLQFRVRALEWVAVATTVAAGQVEEGD